MVVQAGEEGGGGGEGGVGRRTGHSAVQRSVEIRGGSGKDEVGTGGRTKGGLGRGWERTGGKEWRRSG